MHKNNQGQSLLEVLAALGASTLIVTAIVIVVVNALNNAQYSKNQNLATQYAQEGMEIVRNMRNSDYAYFNSLQVLSISYCLDKGDSSITEPDDQKNTAVPVGCERSVNPVSNLNVDNFFAREVQLRSSAVGNCATGKEITAIVSWSDGKCQTSALCHNVTIRSCLTDFNVVPTP